MIFRNATVRHLGLARVLVFAVLLTDLAVDDLPSLACMPVEAFLPHGALKLLPTEWWPFVLSESFLRGFQILYASILILAVAGVGRPWFTTSLALVGTTFFHGLARGFGGHVNHQELITLHAAFFFLFDPSYESFSANTLFSRASARRGSDETARFLLRSVSFWVLLTYFYIGVARLQTSDWRVYGTNAMTFYAVLHSNKWNYWDFSLARTLLEQPVLARLLQVSFPMATVLEIAAPLAVFFRRLTVPLVLALVLFHVSILLFMNIFFWQNIVLLGLPLLGWFADRSWRPRTKSGHPLVVFFDGDCGLCNRFVSFANTIDEDDLLSFAPLQGETAKEIGIALPPNRDQWTIIVSDGRELGVRSDAVIAVLQSTRRWADVGDVLAMVPRSVRDFGYRMTARYRSRLFPNATCGLASQAPLRKLLP